MAYVITAYVPDAEHFMGNGRIRKYGLRANLERAQGALNAAKRPRETKRSRTVTKVICLFSLGFHILLFFVFFASFVVNAFFTARCAQERQERKERTPRIFFARRATNLLFFAAP
jgi:hypothetical protein